MYKQLHKRYRAKHKRIPDYLRVKLLDLVLWDPLKRARKVKVGKIRIVYTGRYITLQLVLYMPMGLPPITLNLYLHGVGIVDNKGKVIQKFLFRKRRKKKKKK